MPELVSILIYTDNVIAVTARNNLIKLVFIFFAIQISIKWVRLEGPNGYCGLGGTGIAYAM